ncbi:MAG: phosphotransferase family protein [Saprospiraceae bacterium]
MPVTHFDSAVIQSLHEYLREQRLPGAAAAELTIEKYPGGYSNLTYEIGLGAHSYVLRRPPPGVAAGGTAHNMEREYGILKALEGRYSGAPDAYFYCGEAAVIGAPFYVMQRVAGLVLRPGAPVAERFAPADFRRLSIVAVDTLAELHAVDTDADGLRDLGRPAGYIERQIGGWSRRYERARTHDLPAMERAAVWLAANLPAELDRPALLHNDFKYDNLLLDPAEPTHILALLDWEMATLGDPRMDLGTTLAYWSEAGDPPALRPFNLSWLPGNLTRRELLDRYTTQTGVDTAEFSFFYVYGLFKVGVICQQIYARYRQGHTQDKRFAGLGEVVRACGALAERTLEEGM